MGFQVLLAEDAERDIEDIYIVHHDSAAAAGRVIDALDDPCRRLTDMPERGNIPKELSALGVTDHREPITSRIASSTGSSDALSSSIAWSTAGETCKRFLSGGFYADRTTS